MVEDKDERRVEGDDQCSSDQTDWIENIHHLPGHKASCDGEDKDTVTEPSERLITKIFGPFLFAKEDSIEEIDRRPHGVEPSTEEIAKDENEKKNSKSREHPRDDSLFRKDCDHPDKGIEPKVEINRNLELEGKGSVNNKIEEEDEGKSLNRPPQVGDRSCHAALTFFTRTFERSISPNPNS